MKLPEDILKEIQHHYTLHRRLSIPYLQRKWKLSADMATEVVKYLTIGMKC